MSMIRRSAASLALAIVVSTRLTAGESSAQNTVANLRLVQDTAGTPLEPESAPPGEKLFHLDHGADKLHMAFDFTGSTPTDVEIRVTGPMGAILFQESQSYDRPGNQVVVFDNKGVPLEDNEYVINAYVGKDRYLADSVQLTIGAAVIPSPNSGNPPPLPSQPTLAGGGAGGGTVPVTPPGPARSSLLLAIVGMLGLLGIALWAGWSAMRRG